MAKLGISTGTTPNDGTGDSMLSGAVKINSNFNELYTLLGNGTNLSSGIVTSIVAGTGVTISGATGQVTINAAGGSGTNYWSQTSAGINTLSNVGIGTTNPTNTLTVYGPNATIRINDTASNASTTIAYGSITLNSNGVIQQIGDTQYFRAGQSGSSSYLFDNYYSGFSHELFYIDTYGSIRAAGNAKITGITTTATLNVGTGATIAQFDGNSYSIPGGTSTSNGVILKHQQNTKLSTTSTGISVGDQLIINSTPSTTRFTSYGPNIYGSGDFYFKCNIGGSGDTGTDILYISSSGASILGNTYTNQLTVGTGGTVITTTAAGLVGIGTTNPTSALTVKGNTSLQNLNVTGVSTFTDNIEFVPSVYGKYIKLGGNNTVYLGSSNEVYFYRYEGLPNNRTVFYQNSGAFDLTAGGFSFSNGSGSSPYAVFGGTGTALYHKGNDIAAVTLRYNTTDTGTEIYKDFSVKVNNGNDLFVVKNPGSGLTTDAKVGIGTTNPTSTLTVRGGDISVGINTSQGVILTSADGTKYRLFVENGGTLKTVVVP